MIQAIKGLEIENKAPRAVVCNRIPSDNFFGWNSNKDMLKLGRVYHIERLVVHKCNTEVFLKEFPGFSFNSVCFGEVENSKAASRLQSIIDTAKNRGRVIKKLRHLSSPRAVNIQMSRFHVKLTSERMSLLKDGDILVIGRDASCDINITKTDRGVSRYHCVIVKNSQGYDLYDMSLSGTTVWFD
ncbi:MAG: FHA domain-containing protein [Alphaproteobacteria bacterium]|nr:FHA domain-containing protein [Alphaproteobacteria bacterium]